MDELVQFVEAHPAGVESEDEQHALNQVRLARAVGSHHASEIAVELADDLPPCVGFEILKHHVVYHQTRPLLSGDIERDYSSGHSLSDGLDLWMFFFGGESGESFDALAAVRLLVHANNYKGGKERQINTN